jgi:fructose/tagatose bisphosphate aldolase
MRLIRARRRLTDTDTDTDTDADTDTDTDTAAVPVSVHWDHARGVAAILAGVTAGADAVLVDGSVLAYEENIQLIRAARVAICNSRIVLGAQLGGLSGYEVKGLAMPLDLPIPCRWPTS